LVQGDGPTGITVKTLVSLLRIGDVKIVCMPGELFPEKTVEITTIIYQEDAAFIFELLYGDIG
jgi:hypothetical protein